MNKVKIQEYYNSQEWLILKVKEFVYGNKRIERCLKLLYSQLDEKQKLEICEIGCSIGLTSYEIAEKFPLIKIDGYDIAADQIEFANKVFGSERLNFIVHDFLTPLAKKYDVITLFDVFEHIPKENRKSFIQNIGHALKPDGKIIITVPSEFSTTYNMKSRRDLLQVVDEVVTLADLVEFSEGSSTVLNYFQLVSVWQTYDYAHASFDRNSPLKEFSLHNDENDFIYKIKAKLGITRHKSDIQKRRKLIAEKVGIQIP